MSRIGRNPVMFDSSLVKVAVSSDGQVVVKGAKHSLTILVKAPIKAKVEENRVVLSCASEESKDRALFGLYRALIQNAVIGVTKGFSRDLELVGVGYKAAVNGRKLEMSLGYSHPIVFDIPDTVEMKVEKNTMIRINGPNKALVGRVASEVRKFRPPEPYQGKGIKYTDEVIRRKAGKTVAATTGAA